jgi:hypothetical protein
MSYQTFVSETLLVEDAESLHTAQLAAGLAGARLIIKGVTAGEALDAAMLYARRNAADPACQVAQRQRALEAMYAGGAVVSVIADIPGLAHFHTLSGQLQG